MALKPPKPDKETLLKVRYANMAEAFKIDGGKCQSPFHKNYVVEYGKHDLSLKVKDVHHLHSRTNTGEYDALEYLITLCRYEHELCENGGLPIFSKIRLTGREYEYLILHLLRKSPKFRWNKPINLIDLKLDPERVQMIQGIDP